MKGKSVREKTQVQAVERKSAQSKDFNTKEYKKIYFITCGSFVKDKNE